ncbi:MAG: FG-GAP-like repeat-containing protein, partial [Verrucomicrobiota bacterium]
MRGLWLFCFLLFSSSAYGFSVTRSIPSNGAFDVPLTNAITVRFDESVDAATVNSNTFKVRGLHSLDYVGVFSFPATNTVRFVPAIPFRTGERIEVSLSQSVLSLSPMALTPYTFSFYARGASSCSSFVFIDTGQRLANGLGFAVELGDLDGDSDLDAIVADFSGSDRVWLNDGTGRFTAGGSLPESYSTEGIALGDLDNDGDLDVFGTGREGHGVWLNNGGGMFVDSEEFGGFTDRGRGVALGDLDGDGDLDAFLARNGGNRVRLNDGTGSFAASSNIFLGNSDSHNVALGDLDGDGDIDAFVANASPLPNRVWLNDGTGMFSDSGQALGDSSTVGVDLGDIDGDGDLDAVTANQFAPPNRVWLNDGSGVFSDSLQLLGTNTSMDVRLGDVDGDGDLDIYTSYFFRSDRVWLNDGAGVFSNNISTSEPLPTTGVGLGDLDGDGDLDAFVATYNNQPDWNRIWLQRCPAQFGDRVWHDLNGDGLQSPGEPGVSNVTVEAWSEANLLDSALTDSNGYYQLSIPAYSNTEIRFIAPTGFLFTLQDQGADDALDSDVPANGVVAVTPIDSTTNSSIDAGLLPVFVVVSNSPAAAALDVSTGAGIQMTFNHPIDPSTVNEQTLIVQSRETGIIWTGSLTVVGTDLSFTPDGPFRPGDRITVHLVEGMA